MLLDNGSRCPVYPTDLVIALDMSAGVIPQAFEQMRSAVLSLLEDISIAETNCPWGARVSVISYSSETRNLIRFADHLKKKSLQEAVKTFALERTTKTRDIGQAMSFVARNVFKRVRKGRLMRKVAVFFTNGPSRDESSLATAMLEFKAADIGLGVIALNPADDVSRAMQVDMKIINLHMQKMQVTYIYIYLYYSSVINSKIAALMLFFKYNFSCKVAQNR